MMSKDVKMKLKRTYKNLKFCKQNLITLSSVIALINKIQQSITAPRWKTYSTDSN